MNIRWFHGLAAYNKAAKGGKYCPIETMRRSSRSAQSWPAPISPLGTQSGPETACPDGRGQQNDDHRPMVWDNRRGVCMILNLTQHPATPEQVEDGVVDLPAKQRQSLVDALTVDALPDREAIEARCDYIAELACQNGLGGDDNDDPHPPQAMIAGASWMISAIENALKARSIEPIHSFSRRVSVEKVVGCVVIKSSEFKHLGFIPVK